ncbi:MAG: nucleotidyltransferase substrate binding protein [Rhodoferax sp.]
MSATPQGEDTRWQQRLQSYQRALAQLESAVALHQTRPLSELERQGLVQAFEFTHELAWNLMKDYAHYQGDASITGSRDATRAAFAVQLVQDGQGWMDMIRSRNLSSHTYNQDIAQALEKDITQRYLALMQAFALRMAALAHG